MTFIKIKKLYLVFYFKEDEGAVNIDKFIEFFLTHILQATKIQ